MRAQTAQTIESDRTLAEARPENKTNHIDSITRHTGVFTPEELLTDRVDCFWLGWKACEEFYAKRLRELDSVDPSTADWLRSMWGLSHEGN